MVVVEVVGLLLGLDAVSGGDGGELDVGVEVWEGGAGFDVVVVASFAGAEVAVTHCVWGVYYLGAIDELSCFMAATIPFKLNIGKNPSLNNIHN